MKTSEREADRCRIREESPPFFELCRSRDTIRAALIGRAQREATCRSFLTVGPPHANHFE